MDVIFMGTPLTAVPILKSLIDDPGINVKLVVCQPDKPKGRGNKLTPPPVKELAIEHNIEVFQPDKLKNNEEALQKLKSYDIDFLVVVAYGKILPKEVLDIPKKAPINVHYSLLPKYRGAAPVNWAIINGEKETGVATMYMDEGLDTGDILLVESVFIDKKNTEELLIELSDIGARLLIKTLKEFDTIIPVKQDDSQATYAPMMKKDDGLIDWNKDAEYIERLIRGFYPWPSAYTKLNNLTFKIFKSEVVYEDYANIEPGTIYEINRDNVVVKCGKDSLKLQEIQLEGKKRMDVKSFLSGYKLEKGTVLG
ncbi:methionyl-tRNA formyltransferase [Deferribacteraceae bacterium V6Fe1]|nr:methionyl-tRNA formyltransferase [Deferribacteraceae bacterium V6Fe1]